MSFSRFLMLTAIGGLAYVSLPCFAEAQIVRRFAGGGVQIRAPFVRVNVGPGGATSVRAPFTAVDSPGRTYVGPRRRLMAQPQYAAPTPTSAAQPYPATPSSAGQPTPVHVDDLPYPTEADLAGMDDAALVETLREMMARLHYRLSLLNTGEGWQNYLVLSREILGSPGAPPEAADVGAILNVLPRYGSVQADPQFVKIATLPSFVATYAALQHAGGRLGSMQPSGPETTVPSQGERGRVETRTEQANEILPRPVPDELPNANRGERSILKRK